MFQGWGTWLGMQTPTEPSTVEENGQSEFVSGEKTTELEDSGVNKQTTPDEVAAGEKGEPAPQLILQAKGLSGRLNFAI